MNGKHMTHVLAVAAAGVMAFACSPEPVHVAIMTKLEAGSLVGSSEVNAAHMAIEDMGMNGMVVVDAYDDGWIPEKTELAWDSIRKDGIDLVITSHVSSCAIALARLAADQDVLIFVTGATTTELTGKADRFVRNVPDLNDEQTDIAAWVRAKAPASILIVCDTDNDAYTKPALKVFTSELGGIPWRTVSVSMRAIDADAVRAGMEAAPYDLLYFLIGGYLSTTGVLAQLGRLVQPECVVLFTPWMKTPALLETAGSALDGAYLPSFYPARGTDSRVDSYIDRYKAKYGYAPTFISLNVYSAMEILLDRIRQGIRSPGKILDSIVGTEVQTSFGPLSFDRYGDNQRPVYMIDDIAGEF
ncbi:MAG: amino acid ABC transporter substrate-binding protein [Spirochaetales bacterium]|nr:MAG: amino acid ABC transporter substrate-binding protein [Spirochaetales bacterium]